jgi:hypothetical protein
MFNFNKVYAKSKLGKEKALKCHKEKFLRQNNTIFALHKCQTWTSLTKEFKLWDSGKA